MSNYTLNQAVEEASKCLLCYDAPCSKGCPAETNPAKFIRSIRFNNLKGAAEIIRSQNILGGICARVCPYDQLCQENCVRAKIDESIQIGKLQEFICDYEQENNMKILEKNSVQKENKVAVIGSGPAGLAAAGELALSGYQVKVFEKRSLLGGWMSFGIPAEKLPQKVVEQELDYIKDLGVQFEMNCEVTKDISFSELEAEYDAFLIAVGKPYPKVLDIKGSSLKDVSDAVSFLTKAKTKEEKLNIENKKIVIVGGGNVAVDCAVTAKEAGAADVNMVCVESLAEIPCSEKDLLKAYKKNVNVFASFKPGQITGEEKVEKFTALSVNDESKLELDCDLIIFAVGQKTADLKGVKDIEINNSGFIKVDQNLKTKKDNIFAAGDIIDSDNTVVNAIADGKKAAENIIKYLENIKEKVQVSV